MNETETEHATRSEGTAPPSDARSLYLRARLAVQAEIQSIERSSTVDFVSRDGRRKTYDYVDLAALLDYVLPILSKHGLVLTTTSSYETLWNERTQKASDGTISTERVRAGAVFGITATLSEVTAGYSESETIWHEALDLRDIKERGALITYMRRYAIMSLLSLAARGEDDDAGSGGRPRGHGGTQDSRQQAPTKLPHGSTGKIPSRADQLKAEFEAIGLTESEMLSLRMANITTVAAVVELYNAHGRNKAAMLRAVNGEGEQ